MLVYSSVTLSPQVLYYFHIPFSSSRSIIGTISRVKRLGQGGGGSSISSNPGL